MTKETRLEKAWGRNPEFYECKGVYFLMGDSIKRFPTPKQLRKRLKKDYIRRYGSMPKQ